MTRGRKPKPNLDQLQREFSEVTWYAPLRRCDDYHWIQITGIASIAGQAARKGRETDLMTGPAWAKANPMVGLATLTVTPTGIEPAPPPTPDWPDPAKEETYRS